MTSPDNRFVCMVAYTEYATDARIRREAETLVAHGFHVRCLALRSKNAPRPRRYEIDGVEVIELSVAKYRGKSRAAYLLSYVRFLGLATLVCARLLVRHQVDVVHVHNIPDFLVMAGFVPRLAGKKIVLDVHDSVPETFATKFSNGSILWRLLCLEERLCARMAHRVICVNHPQRDTLVSRGIPETKIFVSMNVPDPAIFGRAPSVHARRRDSVRLVYHGTMARRLGVDLVIQAFASVQARMPGLELHLWGHGDDLVEFQRLAADLDVSRSVVFRPEGFALRELPLRLREMDIGVIGNRRSLAGELMLPVKLLEYVALDIPVVVPRLTTIQRYFADDMVSYYTPEEVESLAACIHRLSAAPQIRARQAERARAFLLEHGWERQGPELVTFYKSLVGHELIPSSTSSVGHSLRKQQNADFNGNEDSVRGPQSSV